MAVDSFAVAVAATYHNHVIDWEGNKVVEESDWMTEGII